jgi:hypothetical protein
MSTAAERKCALFLTTLRRGDRRRVLAMLPAASARQIRALLGELDAMPIPATDLVGDVLADEVRGLTATTSLGVDELARLARAMDATWFARVLVAWPSVNRAFCISMLDSPTATLVRGELARLPALPPRLAVALQAEAAALLDDGASA